MATRTAHDTITTATWTQNPGTTRREVIFRRSVVIGMATLVGAAALGLLGPREATARAEGEQGAFTVVFPQVTRPGLQADLTITLTPASGESEVALTLPQDALAVLGVETIHPEPARQVSGDGTLTYEFEVAEEGRATITFNGRVPVKQGPGRTRWWVESPAGAQPARATMTTWVLP